MRKFIFLLLLLLGISFLGFRTIRQNVKEDLAKPVILPSVAPTLKPTTNIQGVRSSDIKRSILVPYWGLKGEKIEDEFDSYLYFGISPAGSGINKKETGYVNLEKFTVSVPKNSEKKLVLRMLESDVTFPILKDTPKQKVLIRDTLSTAKENGFSGIVLDLEISAVPFDSLINQINSFTKLFYAESKKQGLEFTIMFYGDTFYRIRPFDVKVLSKNADDFMLMSYDFSKSRGNPGPNFPLRGKEVYGYDMTRMTEDFLRYLPPDKASVVFGMFGYDWTVDDKGTATSQGEPLTYLEIQKKFLPNCTLKNCSVKRKNDSKETEIRYTDGDNKNHIVWFEDMESVKLKQDFLREKGIKNFSFWAYSYF